MKLPFLHQEVEVSTDLRDSNDIVDNPDALKERIAADGYPPDSWTTRQECCPHGASTDSGKTGGERYACTGDTLNGRDLQPGVSRTYVNGFNGE